MTRSRDTANIDTILTTKGDIYAASAAYTPTRLAVGNNGETLVADSSTSTGLRYNPQNALANPVINGGLDIWQRGTSFTITAVNTYTADRWTAGRGGGAAGQTVSRQTVSDSTNLPNILYAIRSQRTAGNTTTNGLNLVYTLESQNSKPFAGKTVTISFYARRGANFSAASNAIAIYLNSGTGTDETVWNGFTGQTSVVAQGLTLTTTWQRFAITGNVPSNSNQLGFYLEHIPAAGTAGADDWFEVTGFQIDFGTYTASTAPTFRRSGGTLAGELYACKRYYQREIRADVVMTANSFSTTNAQGGIQFTQEMRVAPTVTLAAAGQTGGTISFLTASANYPTTTGTNTAPSITAFGFQISGSGYSGLTANSACTLYANGSTTVYTASAEL